MENLVSAVITHVILNTINNTKISREGNFAYKRTSHPSMLKKCMHQNLVMIYGTNMSAKLYNNDIRPTNYSTTFVLDK